MIQLSPSRKNKINLADYEYQKDLKNRLLMSQFTVFDVEVLEEILLGSLEISIPELAADLDADVTELMRVLDKLTETGLFIRDDNHLHINKEMRKYYEFQIKKFDDRFKPNIDFLQSLLRKVPIHVLPSWYSIPRTSTNIFESIVEKNLFTPRLYRRYLLELNLGDPILNGIMEDVFTAEDFKVRSHDLREKYNLSHELFEECMLHLEFNFICCLSYNQVDDQWKEVVTPFHEWRELLRFQRDTKPESLDPTCVTTTRHEEGSFAKDFTALIQRVVKGPMTIRTTEAPTAFVFDQRLLEEIATICELGEKPAFYFDWVLQKIWQLGLAAIRDNEFVPLDAAQEWSEMSPSDLPLAIYRHPRNRIISKTLPPRLIAERNLREAEKALSQVAELGWLDFEEFCKGVIVPLGGSDEVTLKKVGTRWTYVLPTYTTEHHQFLEAAIFERFYEAGFVETGTHGAKRCFKVTDYGKTMLSLA